MRKSGNYPKPICALHRLICLESGSDQHARKGCFNNLSRMTVSVRASILHVPGSKLFLKDAMNLAVIESYPDSRLLILQRIT